MNSHPLTQAEPQSLAIRCDGLRVNRGSVTVLDGLDLSVATGKVHALLGRNGAGKSTTFRVLLGLIDASEGKVNVLGHSRSKRHDRSFLARVGASIDGPALYGHLSAFDNLLVHGRLTGMGRARIEDVLEVVGLSGTGKKRSRYFSTGMKARLALGIAILTEPELLILDEPQNGLDPQGIVELRSLLRSYAASGRTVLVSSHQLGEVVQLADDISVLADGKCRYEGPLEQFAKPGQLEQRFLELTMPSPAVHVENRQ
ncbi:ATP-binding cassette domain-containing protein [Brevibacterium luteolum]|uniref:ATP-binding cassette domain-containing protein n=1 Tax=Brevibacterium luteolum TaxID=199591 RepID=UPI0021B06969|nr:ATP-binding cassette domain-containing protein [Brevibacterium luteolum]MCT1658296.1 ATP-binding cassette domain-containing protein [Brevibacterium luteolum]MCT1922783.1 ATP-binding cassette domain-containing protein [Brevibacterium luteolum]